MRILFFGNVFAQDRNESQAKEIENWIHANLIPSATFVHFENTTLINDINRKDYDALFMDLSGITKERVMERQYITRTIIRMAEDRPYVLYVAVNDTTYAMFQHEAIKPLSANLVRMKDIQAIKKWLYVKKGIR